MGYAESQLSSAHTYTMRQLNQQTAEVLREINESGTPAAITRHGRFIALITPLANKDVESAVLDAVVDAAENSSQLRGERTAERLLSTEELAEELGINILDE